MLYIQLLGQRALFTRKSKLTYDLHMRDYYVIKGPPPHLMNHALLPALFKYEFEVLSCASYIMQYTVWKVLACCTIVTAIFNLAAHYVLNLVYHPKARFADIHSFRKKYWEYPAQIKRLRTNSS